MNSFNDLVSVVIPVYNSEKFLAESIESVLNQTYKNLEIIAINDGSTDRSLDILKQYSSDIIIINQANQGLATSLNNAIKKMTSRWLKWLSPDDVLNSKAIEILANEAKKQPENTILYSNWTLIDENDKKLRDFKESNYNDLDELQFNTRLLDGQQVNVNTTLIPSLLFSKGCLFRELKYPAAIDYDFFLRAAILFHTKFHLINRSFLKYRISKNQLSHKNVSKTLSYLDEVKNDILSMIDITTKEKYLKSLQELKRKKSLKRKTMETGLNLALKMIPGMITDHILVYYLNNIRSNR